MFSNYLLYTSLVLTMFGGCCFAKKPAVHYIATNVDRRILSNPFVNFNSSRPTDTVYRFWTEDAWVTNASKSVFRLDNGIVTVTSAGTYLIYVTVTFHDFSGRWSVGVLVANEEKIKCLASEQLGDLAQYNPTSHGVYHQCSITFVTYLRMYQTLSLKCLYGSRFIITNPHLTFWGIVKQ